MKYQRINNIARIIDRSSRLNFRDHFYEKYILGICKCLSSSILQTDSVDFDSHYTFSETLICIYIFSFGLNKSWFKHILLVNTKGLEVANLGRKNSPKIFLRSGKYMHNRSTVLSWACHYCLMHHHTTDLSCNKLTCRQFGIIQVNSD